MHQFDILGIGNSVVDLLYEVDEEFVKNNILELKREIDNGHEICESSLPAVIAGQKGLVEEKDLKIPSMRGIMSARTKTLEVIESHKTIEKKLNPDTGIRLLRLSLKY